MGIFILFSFIQLRAASISSTALGGNWSNPATWVGNVIPGNGDDVTIANGATVILDADATVGSLAVSGNLWYETTTARTLVVDNILTITSGGSFKSGQSGNIRSHRLVLIGSIINNGTLDFSSMNNTTGVEMEFTGADNAIFNSSDAALTNLKEENGLVLNKGTSPSSVLSVIPGSRFEVESDGGSNASGFLTILNGTFNLIGSKALINPVFSAAGDGVIPATGGFWLGNQNATVLGTDRNLVNYGELQISNGTFQVGTSGEKVLLTSGNGVVRISGGTLIAGKLNVEAGLLSISGGKVNLANQPADESEGPTLGVSANARLELYGSPMITLAYAHPAGKVYNDIEVLSGLRQRTMKGGTIMLGTEATPEGSIFFVNAERILDRLKVYDECGIRVLNTSKVDIEHTPADALPVIAFDKIAPTLTAPAPITLNCSESIPAAYASLSEFIKAGGQATDNCGLSETSFKLLKEVKSSEKCPYILTRTYEVADKTGNKAVVVHQLVVKAEPEKAPEPLAGKPEEVLKLKLATASFTAIKSGPWNDPATWGTSITPTASDDVVVGGGYTVSVDAAAFCNNITINSGSTLNYSGTNTLTVNGNWTNNGIYTAGTTGIITFGGTTAATIGGSGTTVFKQFVVSKGAQTNIVQVNSNIELAGDITLTSGILQINSGVTVNCTHNTGFTIEQLAGMKILGTFNSGAFSIDNKGKFEVAGGTANLGTAVGNSLTIMSSGDFILSSGQINIAGRLEVSGGDATISGGTLNLNTVGNNSATASLYLSPTSTMNMSGGSIVFKNPNSAGNLDMYIETGGSKSFSGGNITFGTGTAGTYRISSEINPFPSTISAAANANLIYKLFVTANGTYNFPLVELGNNAIPATVTLTGGTLGANAYIQLETYSSKDTHDSNTTKYLKRYWVITTGAITSPAYNVTANFLASDLINSPTHLVASAYSAGWTKISGATIGANSVSFNNNSPSLEFTLLEAPTVTITNSKPQTICSGSSVTLITSTTADSPVSYLWSPSTGLSNATISNPVASPAATTTFTVTVTDGNGFTATDAITVNVNPLPSVTNSSTASICSGTAPNIALTASIPSNFTWTIGTITGGITGASSGSGATINQTLTNPSNATSGSVQYVITPASTVGGCVGTPFTITVTVNPLPSVTNSSTASVCSGTGPNIALGATTSSTFAWTIGTITGGITGASASAGPTINQTLTNPSNSSAGSVQYIVTPTSTTGSCVGTPFTITVTVNPTPTVNAVANPSYCHGVNVPVTALSGPVAGTTFVWTNSNPAIGLAASGTGNIPSFTASNATAAPITATISITPTANGCTGTVATYTITVNPLPVPTISGPLTACSGSTGNVYTTETGMSGYSWTVSAGGTITSGGSTATLTVSWNVAGSQAVQVTYTDTKGCNPSAPTVKSITVNQTPTVVITNPGAVCSPTTVDLTAAAVTSGSTPGLAFTYYTDAGATVTLTTPAAVTTSGTYYIKGTIAAGCSDIKPVTVIINPKPTVVITNPTAVCSPSTVNISAAAVTAGSTAGLTYTYWTDAAATVALANYSTVSVTGIYYIKGTSAAGCNDIKSVSVTINQTPSVTNANTKSICTGSSTNISLTATVASSFSWTIGTISGTVTGASAGSGPTINQTLSSSGVGGTVQYLVTPATGTCTGTTYTITVSVIVPPSITLNPAASLIVCEESYVDFKAGASGSPMTIQWQISKNGGTSWANFVDDPGSPPKVSGATTNLLNIYVPKMNGAGGEDYNGYLIRAIYTNSCGTATSTNSELTVANATFVNKPPDQIGLCAGGTVTLTAKTNANKDIYAQFQRFDGTNWNNVGPLIGPRNGTVTVSYSFVSTAADNGARFRIYFTGSCGAQYSEFTLVFLNTIVTTVNSCLGSGSVTFTQNGSPGGTWSVNGGGTITSGGVFTPSAVGCYNATYANGTCVDTEPFIVFPASPVLSALTSSCGSTLSLPNITPPSGFSIQYAVQAPSGTMSAWGTYAQAQALLSNTPGCWTIKARYVLAADCGTFLAGTTSTATGCSETSINAFVFPAKPVLTAPFNTCASAFTLPSVPAITGFNVEYSIDGGTFAASPAIPTTPGCHNVKARYVVATACGTVPAGATGGVSCESDPVYVVIFPSAPPAPTVSAGCGAFTVTPPPSVTGFNIEYSYNNGTTWSSSNSAPAGENCTGYTVMTRYVLAATCGSTTAGVTGAVAACSSSPSIIRKVDTTPPTLTCNTTAPQTVCVNSGSNYIHSGTSWDATVTDNCSVQSISAALSGATTATNLTTLNNVSFNIGTTVVTWTASDGCNSSTCSFSVTVNPKPVINPITAPAICSGGTFSVTPLNGTNGTVPVGTTYSWAAPVVSGITGAMAGTNAASISGTLNNTTSSPIQVVYTVTPATAAGCVGANFTVTVTVNPVLTCSISGPAGPLCPNSTGNIFSAAGGMTSYTWSINGNGTITAGGNTQTVTVAAGANCNSPFLLSLNYNDTSGCSSSCSVTVGVVDVTGPVFSALPGTTTVSCTATPTFAVASATDGCGGAVSITAVDTTNLGACAGSYSITRVWTAVDACGNTTTASQTINVQDTTPPVISALPGPTTISCTATPTFTVATAADACGTVATLTFADVTTPGACAGSYSVVRTWTAIDACGNTSTASQTINVQDTTPPTITCPGPHYQNTNTDLCLAFPVNLETPTTTDGCGTVTLSNNAPAQFPVGTTTITWTATDSCGNIATCTQDVIISDVQPPLIDCQPLVITVNVDPGKCGAAVGLVTPSYTENCGAPITVSLFRSDGQPTGADFPVGSTTIVWTITDASNNATTCTQTIVVIDNIPATLTCPPGYSVAALPFQNYASNVGISTPTYSDNCGNLWLTWTLKDNSGATVSSSTNVSGISLVTSPYPQLFVGDNSITYTLTDVGGGVQSCTFIITVISRPDISCPASITTYTAANNCSATLDPGVPTLLQGAQPITWNWYIDNPLSADVTGTSTTTPGPIGSYTFDIGTTTITWTASNISGSDSCTQTVTVIDNIPPIYTPPPTDVEYCVESLISATYNSSDPVNNVTINPDPDYYLFHTGVNSDTSLDLNVTNLTDNCCSGTITWTITFVPVPDPNNPGNTITYPSVSGTGQPSAYSANIQIWGDGVTFLPVVHRIDYTVTDCHGNPTSFHRDITVKPRPKLTKMP